jgi:hypothetical protein
MDDPELRTTRGRLQRQRMVRRRRILVAAITVLALAGAAYWAFGRTPDSYDLAASRACLTRTAVVREVPRRERLFPAYPGLSIRFRSEPPTHVAIYFAPNNDEAASASLSGSERLQRRRNVLGEYLADAPWDRRVLGCLRERGSS